MARWTPGELRPLPAGLADGNVAAVVRLHTDHKEDFMAYVAPAVLLLCVFVAADITWAELRDRRARCLAIKRGSTLTRRFGLPLPLRS